MTTMVISVQWGETELPRERARLYEACVRAIIQAQYIPDDPARQQLINWGGPWEAQRDWLSELALAMHKGGRGSAAIREEQVRSILATSLAGEEVDAFLKAVRYRGGLYRGASRVFPVRSPHVSGISGGAATGETTQSRPHSHQEIHL